MGRSNKQTTNAQTSMVMTPTNPEWVTSGAQGLAGKIADIGKLDPYSLIAKADPLQTQAAQGAAGLGADRSWFDKIMAQGTPSVGAESLLTGLDRYMSPYTKNVHDAALADYDYGADTTKSQLALDTAGPWAGSGAALTSSNTLANLVRGRATTSANLLDQGFTRGAALASEDANRRQQAGVANAQLALQDAAQKLQAGLSGEASTRSNIAAQADLGAMLRGIEAQHLNAPISLATTQAGLFGSLPLQLFQGQTQNGTSNSTTTSKSSDPLGALGSLAMLVAAPFTGGASLAGMGLSGLLGAAGGLGAAKAATSWSPAWGGGS